MNGELKPFSLGNAKSTTAHSHETMSLILPARYVPGTASSKLRHSNSSGDTDYFTRDQNISSIQ